MKSNENGLHEEIKKSLRGQTCINVMLWAIVVFLLVSILKKDSDAMAAEVHKSPVEKTTIQSAAAQPPIMPVSPGNRYGSPGGALWKFESGCWNGWIDIRTDGLYFTHWGWGHWTKEKDGSFLLQNDHDSFSHRLRFDGNNQNVLKGERDDGVWERCEMVFDYAKMPPPHRYK